ncbi:MAG: RimK family alpha-L-glutamate ligase [Myxococcaceae bacterium]
MRVTILSRSASIPSTKRLVEAAKARGHSVRVLNPLRVQMQLDGASAELTCQRKKVPSCDVVIPRIAQSVSTYGLAVVNQFALRGTPILNSAAAIGQARNKMRALQLLSANRIAIPATVMARDTRDLRAMVRRIGGVPVLVKLIQGQERHGVMVCESLQSLEAALEAILGLGHDIVLQEYVKGRGQDVRVFVVGGRAIAAVHRKARWGRLARTLNRGAQLERYRATEAMREAAVDATRLMGLEVAAVDMLNVQGAPKVFEVNSSPGIVEMERACRVDLAGAVIARAEVLADLAKRASKPRKATG